METCMEELGGIFFGGRTVSRPRETVPTNLQRVTVVLGIFAAGTRPL